MINVLSYVGMNMQSEVCLWCLLGLVRTIFDATLFKVNANLKQVWQMNMPDELSKPVQRVLRTMVSGIMLVQCFTVYIYLAAYIVLLYPVFLEERPALVLPWLLLAAVRKLLCELTSLALGLGTCLLLGPARQPCVKFVIIKFASIIPAFYMWMLVFSYYHTLKVAAAFKTFPANLPNSDNDYGLELAVRRRRTKSLFGEDQLRKKLVNFYGEQTPSATDETYLRPALKTSPEAEVSTEASIEDEGPESEIMKPPTAGWSDIDSITTPQDKTVKLTSELEPKRTAKAEEIKLKSKLKKQRGTEGEHDKGTSEIANKELDDLQESKAFASDPNESKKNNSTETPNNQKSKKKPHVAILDAGISKDDSEDKKPKKKADDGCSLKEVEPLTQSKQLNAADICKETSQTKIILNESNERESTLSQFLVADAPYGSTSIKPDSTALKENKKQFHKTTQEMVNDNSKIAKAGTSSEIPKDDSNLSKHKENLPKDEIKTELISKDEKNKELPLRILSTDDKTQGSLVSKGNSKIKITDTKTLNEDNNEYLQKEMLNKDVSNKDSKLKCSYCNRKCQINETKHEELPLRILSNDDTIKNTQNVKVSDKDDSKGSTDEKAPKEIGCNKIGCDCSKQPKHEEDL
ncbi:hypothetical protein PYW08_016505 [Mythimna loreyi]|uniref:Uncharacterized protein n=1 Tax=Mythimna loreyi TaxID=667449 RepID=A0ACC2QZA4_9NEOP|nr:hypothetical protein PYW08_016505 [Mythimna loreyi]